MLRVYSFIEIQSPNAEDATCVLHVDVGGMILFVHIVSLRIYLTVNLYSKQ